MTSRAETWIAATLVGMVTGSLSLASVANDSDMNNALAETSQPTQITRLDNGWVIEGQDIATPDRFTSGFSLTAGYSPSNMPALDLGAEFSYRSSDNVPIAGTQQRLVDTTSLGGNLIAGFRMPNGFGLYAKSGLANWDSETVTGNDALPEEGITRVDGFGARWESQRVISQLEYEHFNNPTLSHLNMITASVSVPF